MAFLQEDDRLRMKEKEDLLTEICTTAQVMRAKLLDGFAKVYLAHLPEGTTVDDIELVEIWGPDTMRRWRYQLKDEKTIVVRVGDDEE